MRTPSDLPYRWYDGGLVHEGKVYDSGPIVPRRGMLARCERTFLLNPGCVETDDAVTCLACLGAR